MTRNGESRAREGPGSQGLGSPTSTQDIAPRQGYAVNAMVAGATGTGVCPRCGVPFGETTDDVLRTCAELARRGAA